VKIELTQQQHQALAGSSEPIRVWDPAARREYVLLRTELYERMRKLLATETVDPSLYEFEEIDPA
jgi:hypothetical protein